MLPASWAEPADKSLKRKRRKTACWRAIFRAMQLAGCLVCVAAARADTADADGFRTEIAPFLKQHCSRCHGEQRQEGDLNLQAIDGDLPSGPDVDAWKSIAERLALNEMPPEGEPRPNAVQSQRVLGWIKRELIKAGEDVSAIGSKLHLPGHGNRVDHAGLFSADPGRPTASPRRIWRMSPQIYMSYVPRLASREPKLGQPFSSSSADGFKDFASLFVVDEPTIGQLMRNAKGIAEAQCGLMKYSRAIKEFEPLVALRHEATPQEIDAAIRKQFQLALLREPSEDERGRVHELMLRNMRDAGQTIGAVNTLAAILMLSEAMYRFEFGGGQVDEHGRTMLAPRELAYAIAFALTDATPDAMLLAAAADGRLKTPADVRREVERLLDDPRTQTPRIMRFFEEYFEFPAAADVFKDLKRGEWRPEVLVHDTRLLIEHILKEDRDVLKQLLTTNLSFVNCQRDPRTNEWTPARPLKKVQPRIDKATGKAIPVPPRDPELQLEVHDHYNLPLDWEWTARQPVHLPAEQRAGILTQPSWLGAFATNNENHAIRRGKWIRERMLGGVVPDLPISVDAQIPDAPHRTLRERMEITQQEYCWQCHRQMNPVGLMFEKFDYLGRFRETEGVVDLAATALHVDGKGNSLGEVFRRAPVDASGILEFRGDPSREGAYNNGVKLMHALADSPRVRQVFVRHAFRYWMGRNETLDDGPTLVRADRAYVDGGGSLRALLIALLTSDSFLYRTAK